MKPLHPVDTGYGWVMVAICCILATLSVDNYGNLGVFMVECQQRFGISTAELTWIGAFRTSLLGLLGVTVGDALQRYGNKAILISGTLLIFLGQCGCALLPKLGFWWLLFTYGIIPGIGFCCTSVVFVSAFQEYFDTRRGVANAIVNSGHAIGLFIWSPLLEHLFSQYSWTGGLLIAAVLHLHNIAFSLLLIPAKEYYNCKPKNNTQKIQSHTDSEQEYVSLDNGLQDNASQHPQYHRKCKSLKGESCFDPTYERQISSSNSSLPLQILVKNSSLSNSTQCFNVSLLSLVVDQHSSRSYSNLHSYTGNKYIHRKRVGSDLVLKTQFKASKDTDAPDSTRVLHDKDCSEERLTKESRWFRFKLIIVQILKRTVDFSLLKEIPFLMFCCGMLLVHLGHTAPLALVTVRAVEEGLSKKAASFVISLYGICSGVSSPFWGLLADVHLLFHVKPLLSGIPSILSGFASLIFFQVKSHTSFIVYASLWGIMSGALILQSLMVAHLLGVERMAKGAGTMYSLNGVAWFLTYILSGIFIDAFGNTVQPFFVLGAIELLGGVTLCAIPVVQKYQRFRQKNQTPGI